MRSQAFRDFAEIARRQSVSREADLSLTEANEIVLLSRAKLGELDVAITLYVHGETFTTRHAFQVHIVACRTDRASAGAMPTSKDRGVRGTVIIFPVRIRDTQLA
jgi:hypothetical protein